ncbi:histidinol-phosphatase [Suttonella sp. R2A3]|uniref:histidinol-phosphatase n=1 Tax=Suttonella sp. R2A3 TaxID=2908648 RepID=UPI001F337FF4|nr:histidinol-phosphatase [Suttonella sp. R2A3]UJF25177.1 histidinol-phosphatase [Suttonella sp. R2A3]
MNLANILPFANQLCDQAATITRSYFRASIDVINKSDDSPVTIADRETEALLREHINERFPDHAIIGEEYGISGQSAWQWVIDPIDGTRSFISGFPTYATLLALLHDGAPVLSIIDMPILGERFIATREQPTTLNGAVIRCQQTHELAKAKLQSTDPDMFTSVQWQKRQQLAKQVALNRFNGDGYLYAMLAAGWIDLVCEADLKPYDFLPLMLIVEQAGGVISDWQGKPLTLNSSGEVLASATGELHSAALTHLNNS